MAKKKKLPPRRGLVVGCSTANDESAYCYVPIESDVRQRFAELRDLLVNTLNPMTEEQRCNLVGIEVLDCSAEWYESSDNHEIDDSGFELMTWRKAALSSDENFRVDYLCAKVTDTGIIFTACHKYGGRGDHYESPELSWDLIAEHFNLEKPCPNKPPKPR